MSDAAVFKAIADPTRRQILQDLQGGALSAGDIAANFDISGPAISRHLAILKSAGLVVSVRNGNSIEYTLDEQRLAHTVGDFLSAVCPTQISTRKRRSE